MKFALIHLSGQHRGETQYFDRSRLSLGSDLDNDLVFPADGPHSVVPSHVELFQDNCEVHLRNRDPSVTTLVNHNPLTEATLSDKDLIQLGPQGPKLRFRIRVDEYATCKRSHEILQDALDLAAEARKDGLGAVGSFFGQLAYDMRRHASRGTQVVVVALLVLLAGALGGGAYYSYTTQQAYERHMVALSKELESSRLTQAVLEQRTAEERRRTADALTTRQVEIDRLVAMLEEHQRHGHGASPEEVRSLRRRLKGLEIERRGAEVLINRYGASVCFLYGAYGFLQKGQLAGAPSVLLEYMGTGFLIDDKGLIVTNRHVMEPWTMDPSAAEMVKSGLQPKLVSLLANFPGRSEPYSVSLIRVSDHGDVALGRLSPVPQGIAPILIGKPARQASVGEAVVVLGYPVGVEGVLARMDDKVAEALIKKPGRNLARLVQDIADRKGIRPLATQGHIGDVVPGRIVYDAPTTGGASGSPVFNSRGQVIAVNAATMRRFGGANFGVPIGLVLAILSAAP